MATFRLDNKYNDRLPFRILRDRHLVLALDAKLPERTSNIAFFYEGSEGKLVQFSAPFHLLDEDERSVMVFSHNPEHILEMLFPHLHSCRIVFQHGETLGQERVLMDQELLRAAYDPLSILTHRAGYHTNPGEVAVVTHCYDEGWMLRRWESHYGAIFGHRNLFVIDDGSSDGSLAVLEPETNVIRIPRGELDHDNMSQYCGYFQRFLLCRYKWVINTDCDEFLVSQGGLLQDILALADGIYKPEHAIMPVHRIGQEAEFDPYRPLLEQRGAFVREEDSFLKPMIASRGTTWSTGFHDCAEESRTMPGLWHVHFTVVDYDRRIRKDEIWGAIKQTRMNDLVSGAVASRQGRTASEFREAASAEFRALLKDRESVVPPDWMRSVL